MSPAATAEPRAAAAPPAADAAAELRRRVFDEVLERLAGGMVEGRRRRGLPAEDEASLAQVLAATLRLVSRVLFLAVAEARGVVPADGAPAYALYGLARIRRSVAERVDSGEPAGEAAAETWDDLLSLLELVEHGDPALGIPGPGGGLLPPADPRDAFLHQNPVPGALLARALDRLWRVGGHPVDFAALGADGVLAVLDGAASLRLAADERGRPRLVNARGERKAPAPSAPPPWVAEYLLGETVGPALDERVAAFRRARGEAAALRARAAPGTADAARAAREADALEERATDALFDLRVLDPWMGSGRLLVAAAGFVAGRLLPLLAEEDDGPLHRRVAAARARLVADAGAQGIAVDPARLDDAALLRRMAARRCLFGVDPDPAAVELARAALALEAAVPGAPPLFLAHRLRRGHPLAGARVAEVARALEEGPGGQLQAFGGPFDGLLPAAGDLSRVERGDDSAWPGAAEAAARDAAARSALAPYRRLLDLWASRAFGNRRAEEAATLHTREVLGAGGGTMGAPQREALERAAALADEHAFFHWDLELPAAFAELEKGAWSADPGFDAVVSRAPERDERFAALRPLLALRGEGPDAGADPHAALFRQALELLRRGGRAGVAGPVRWVRAGQGEGLRRLLGERAALLSVVDFPAEPGPGSCVAVAGRADHPARGEARVAVVPREAHGPGAHAWVAGNAHAVPASRFGAAPWSLEPQVVEALLRRVREAGVPLRDFAGAAPRAGLRTGLNDAYVIDGAAREALVSRHPAADALIRPYLRGSDVERWAPAWAGLWVILLGSGEGERWPWTGLPDPEAEHAFRAAYPSLYAHLKPWEERLRLRQDQGAYWWEMRGVARAADPGAAGIVYADVAWAPAFALEVDGCVAGAGAALLPAPSPWLAAVLNSPVTWGWVWRTAGHGRGEALRLIGQVVETLPVPPPTAETEADAAASVARLAELARERRAGTAELFRWLRAEYDVVQPGPRLEAFADLNATDFVDEVRRRRPRKADALSPRQVGMLRNAHAELAPRLTAVRAKIAGLERRLGQAVARACGLSPAEAEILSAGVPAPR